MPTLVEAAGGPKGMELKAMIETGGAYGFKKTTLDGFNQLDYITGKSKESARDHFIYYQGATLSAVRYKNWKFYYTMANPLAEGWLNPSETFTSRWCRTSSAIRSNRRSVRIRNSSSSIGGALAAPSTAFIYDWNLLPIGQMLWLKELETYRTFPALQTPRATTWIR